MKLDVKLVIYVAIKSHKTSVLRTMHGYRTQSRRNAFLQLGREVMHIIARIKRFLAVLQVYSHWRPQDTDYSSYRLDTTLTELTWS